LLIVLGFYLVVTELWAITHGECLLSAALLVLIVFGAPAATEKWGENGAFFGFLNWKHRSWGFLAMGTLLPWVAWIEAAQWPSLAAPGWMQFFHIPSNAFHTWGWWVFVLVVVAVYIFVIFRPGEKKNYNDYLRFNSWGKLVHDFLATKVSFVVVPCLIPLWLGGHWGTWTTFWSSAPEVATALVVVWGLVLGFWIDLKRLEGQFAFPFSRDEIHVQGTPAGPAYIPALAEIPVRVAVDRMIIERRAGRRIRRPG
jgi:hypothetical protein